MTDEHALSILIQDNPKDKVAYFQSLIHAINKLKTFCWRSYDPKTFGDTYTLSQGMKVHLGIRYSDGSCGCVDGKVTYDVKHMWKLELDSRARNLYTRDAVIEKWMPYPDYTDEDN